MTAPLDPSCDLTPPPDSRRPGLLAALLARRCIRPLLRQLKAGHLIVQLPHGERLEARGALPGPQALIRLHRWRPLLRLLAQGDLGLAIAYRDGEWSTPDLLAVLELGAANEAAWQGAIDGMRPARWLARLAHLRRDNSRSGSRDNIAFHYDLGNAFYERWLDPGLQYSSAIYAHDHETLEAAQARKLGRIVELLDVAPEQSVLEIGCGWGGLARQIAQAGARVTGLTLSTEQLRCAQERAAQAGLHERVDLRLQDYRDVQGRFDRIVSIEMIEAVGEAWWPTYFQVLKDRLAAGGRVVVQAITIDETAFARYRAGADFIQRFIFPGGMLPTPTLMREHGERVGLRLGEVQRFGHSYALTLAEWRRRFMAQWASIQPLGFDERFHRLWEYYLAYCEAGFREGRIDVGLYVFEHGR
ncbi:cyclopropane-fatty-acyl-phospholipid synthase family protein [uncultured Pseudacidovorax sp.]|uniref:SAM-dependent methyltransferase n=1 Tax=uncultured Pseudacidovorax sp. TaxID=679313 RepID=UPI0025DB9E44|nr:cyclopropane-fatty-acyl-phospholipid synthase family protein [uncultured Pseudacidovorax sp.]